MSKTYTEMTPTERIRYRIEQNRLIEEKSKQVKLEKRVKELEREKTGSVGTRREVSSAFTFRTVKGIM